MVSEILSEGGNTKVEDEVKDCLVQFDEIAEEVLLSYTNINRKNYT